MTKNPLYQSLYFQVITAIVISVLFGHFHPATDAAMKPLGDGFIGLGGRGTLGFDPIEQRMPATR